MLAFVFELTDRVVQLFGLDNFSGFLVKRRIKGGSYLAFALVE